MQSTAAMAICTPLIWVPTMAETRDAGFMPAQFYSPFINE
jgi:hypothetical protein